MTQCTPESCHTIKQLFHLTRATISNLHYHLNLFLKWTFNLTNIDKNLTFLSLLILSI